MVTKSSILLTGATGTVGKEVLNQLLEKNKYNIVVFSLDRKKNRKFYSKISGDVTVCYGSLENAADLKK